MTDEKKWNPIEFTQEEEKRAIKLIRDKAGYCSKKELELIEKFLQHYQDLAYFQTINTYLWATDMPDEVQDPKKLLFQIKFRE